MFQLKGSPLPKETSDPKALVCCGLLVSCPAEPEGLLEQMLLRFVDGRSVSTLTVQFLTRTCERLERLGKRALLLIWDRVSWQAGRKRL